MHAQEKRLKTSKKYSTKPEESVKLFCGDEPDKATLITRVIVGASLAILFIFKDLASVISFGLLRLFTETVRWFFSSIIRLTEEITVTFVQVILRGVDELLKVVFRIILQAVDNVSCVFYS